MEFSDSVRTMVDNVLRSRTRNRRRYAGRRRRKIDRVLFLDQLEDRRLLAAGAWLASFEGISPGSGLQEQLEYGEFLLESSGVDTEQVRVVDL